MMFLLSSPNPAAGFILVALGALLYFIPAYVAYKRDKRNKVAILLLDIFLGWTIIGWVGALIWAVSNERID